MFLILNQCRKVPGLAACVSDGPGDSSHTDNSRAGAESMPYSQRIRSVLNSERQGAKQYAFWVKRLRVMGVEMLKEGLLVTNPQERK